MWGKIAISRISRLALVSFTYQQVFLPTAPGTVLSTPLSCYWSGTCQLLEIHLWSFSGKGWVERQVCALMGEMGDSEWLPEGKNGIVSNKQVSLSLAFPRLIWFTPVYLPQARNMLPPELHLVSFRKMNSNKASQN